MALQRSDIAEAVSVAKDELFVKGERLFIRCVTFHAIGVVDRLTFVGEIPFLVFKHVSFVADSGDFKEAILKGKIATQFPLGETSWMRINVAQIVDMFPWDHPLPR